MTEQVIAVIKSEEHSSNQPSQVIAKAGAESHFLFDAPTLVFAKVENEINFNFRAIGQTLAVAKLETLMNALVLQKIAKAFLEIHLTFTIPVPVVVAPVPNTKHPLNIPCIPPPRSRFRRFWATQPDVCPPTPGQCNFNDPTGRNSDCMSPGLGLNKVYDPCWSQVSRAYDGGGALAECGPPVVGASISTENYVRGLVINILGTNAAQNASICGNRPGQRLGYWLDSISGDKSGTAIRYVPTLSFNTAQAVQFVQMQAEADLQKLIKYGVANKVTVAASYIGNGTIGLKITVEGVDDSTTVVNSTMVKISNAWVWNT